MILSFKPQFVQPILAHTKIHTIRVDKHKRWQVGKVIHFATGVRTRNYRCFLQSTCTSIDRIAIRVRQPNKVDLMNYHIWVNGRSLGEPAINRLAMLDGLTVPGFMRWFPDNFDGIIIYWSGHTRRY